ncbi:MAG TPA: tripartite tricarboxylate transporter TctB family protein [Burkholderiales bacterium]|jgi:putative tricarboxylic transport membrane protein|nr:tripartite tricarboxylate transporter TctB family protein [Burkholderiales bacterium]
MIDRIICLIGLALAAIYFYATAQIPSLEIGDPLGPKAFPILLGTVLLIAIVMLFVETLTAGADEAKRVHWWREDRHHLLLIGGVTLWTALYFWTFESAGYLVSTAIYLLAMMAVFHRGKWIANTLTAVLFAIGSYLLFVKVLGVVLPTGILGF